MRASSISRQPPVRPTMTVAMHLYAVGQAVQLKGGLMQRFHTAGYDILGTLLPRGECRRRRIRNDGNVMNGRRRRTALSR